MLLFRYFCKHRTNDPGTDITEFYSSKIECIFWCLNSSDCREVDVQNGTVQFPFGTIYSSVAIVNCDDGYILEGNDHIVCELGATWGTLPDCIRGKSVL